MSWKEFWQLPEWTDEENFALGVDGNNVAGHLAGDRWTSKRIGRGRQRGHHLIMDKSGTSRRCTMYRRYGLTVFLEKVTMLRTCLRDGSGSGQHQFFHCLEAHSQSEWNADCVQRLRNGTHEEQKKSCSRRAGRGSKDWSHRGSGAGADIEKHGHRDQRV